MPVPAQLKPGTLVGPSRFTLIKELGRGGMGVVWLAQDISLGEQVALKFLPPEVCHEPVALNDLRRETLRSHRLTHPNIIRIHDFHQQPDGVAFISMEFVDGLTLSAWRLQQIKQVFAWDQLAPLVKQLCAALEYAHEEWVIHRDLKPANVMLDSRGRVKLADFGIAAVVSDSVSRVSVRSSTGGTLAYMSPQQLEGHRPTAGDDVYALGATLYELLTGRPPFYTGDITHQVLHVTPTPVSERALEFGVDNPVPPEVGALIMACLAKEPEKRPQTATAVAAWVGLVEQPAAPAERFAAALGSSSSEAAEIRSQPVPAAAVQPWFKQQWTWAACGVAVCLVLGGLGWLLLDGNRGDKRIALPPEMQKSLVLYYSFDQPPAGKLVKDLSGAGNDGQVIGARWTPEGKRGGAYAFDKGNETDRIVVRNDPSLNPGRFTLAAWIKSDDGGKTWGRIIDKDFWKGYCLTLKGPEGARPNPQAGYAALEAVGLSHPHPTTQTRVDDGHWHHLVGTHDGSYERCYLDGQQQGEEVLVSGDIPTNAHDLTIGNTVVPFPAVLDPKGSLPPAWAAFHGLIDEVMVFNRALDAEEVKTLVQLAESGRAPDRGSQPAAEPPPTSFRNRWTNSLGMIFVPVPGTDVKFSIWETRVQDFEKFAAATLHEAEKRFATYQGGSFKQVAAYSWRSPGYHQTGMHPVCGVNWFDAQEFCKWLTQQELASGRLKGGQSYRLPTDLEWSAAVGLGPETGATPKDRKRVENTYPWGSSWPPQAVVGNYFGEEAKDEDMPRAYNPIAGYNDRFAKAAPVGSFPASALGLYDLGGNLWEWCEDWYDAGRTKGVLRGGAWDNAEASQLNSASRLGLFAKEVRYALCGFRVVVEAAKTVSTGGGLPRAAATADRHWTNSLGMVFVLVRGTDVKFSIWQTRVQDFEKFAKATGFQSGKQMLCFVGGSYRFREGFNWQKLGFRQGPKHPVVGVSWDEAQAFCGWLTQTERADGRLSSNQTYRLPTDLEWSQAVGLETESGNTPKERSKNKKQGEYYWGNKWPPLPGAGNFADEATRADDWPTNLTSISGYNDGYSRTAPVGSFKANSFWLYDMPGNVYEWCEDYFDERHATRILRGCPWCTGDPRWGAAADANGDLQCFSPANRRSHPTSFRADGVGFRIVLASNSASK